VGPRAFLDAVVKRKIPNNIDLRGWKWREAREDFIMRSFVTFSLHKTFFG
jgi:hypothetical protein